MQKSVDVKAVGDGAQGPPAALGSLVKTQLPLKENSSG